MSESKSKSNFILYSNLKNNTNYDSTNNERILIELDSDKYFTILTSNKLNR